MRMCRAGPLTMLDDSACRIADTPSACREGVDCARLDTSGSVSVVGPPALKVQAIEKAFGRRKVLDGFSLEVDRGEIVGLLGPNGTGKTICFYGIMGLIRLDGGRILLDGEDVSALAMHERGNRGLGYLPQEASIFRGMSVADNIRSVLELRMTDPGDIDRRLGELLADSA